MMLSKLAARQISLRALRAVPQATSIQGMPQNARAFQTSQPQFNARDNSRKKKIAAVYSDEMRLFNDKLNSSSQQVTKIRAASMLMDLEQSMDIYSRLKDANPFSPFDIARLLQSLHTNLRVSRREVNRFKSQKIKNEDKVNRIKSFFLTIAEDLRQGVVQSSEWGYNHLFTAFATMNCPKEGLELWTKLNDREESHVAKAMWSAQVVGSIIDLMNLVNTPFETIEKVYMTSKENSDSANIEQAMVGSLLQNERYTDALALFTRLIEVYPDEPYALSRIHDKFVGDCKDVPIALNFFFEGIRGQTPYKPIHHPSVIARLMDRIWHSETEPDFSKLEEVWKLYIASTPASMGEWMFNNTVNCYMRAFMENYPKPTPEAVAKLKEILQFYIKTRVTITPVFLNTVLSAVQPWADRDIIFTIINAFEIYYLPQDVVSCRIILNSFENIAVDDATIVNQWHNLLTAQVKGLNPLDLLALLRACHEPAREHIFTSLFTALLNQGEISDHTLIELKKAVFANPALESKKNYLTNLLKEHSIEVSENGEVTRLTAFGR